MQPFSNLLNPKALAQLQGAKNLLAFSGGVDSSALFFLLLDHNITFDLAIVDYGKRAQSKAEVAYAHTLADRYQKAIYHKAVDLDDRNFEQSAREARYTFFEEIIRHEGYHNLITAHQLNDRLEWFLMQLSKGAGLVELLGFDGVEERKGYRIVRPLLDVAKSELQAYLHTNKIDYFIDESNRDPRFTRNRFRLEYSDSLIKAHKEGIKRSLNYLQKDKQSLLPPIEITQYHDLLILPRHDQEMRRIDKIFKERGYLLSSAQKREIEKVEEIVIADRFVVSKNRSYLFVSPKSTVTMPKHFKEQCRVLNIPKKIRPYLYEVAIDPSRLQSYCTSSNA